MSTDLTGRTALVVGATRGLGRGVAEALHDGGVHVIGVARNVSGAAWPAEAADATDEGAARRLLDRYRPDLLVLTAGAIPPARPLAEHTWESFSTAWNTDVRAAFTWLRAVLRSTPPPASRVIVFGSAAELRGSPLSGGYAGAKATVRLITGYARTDAAEGGPTFTTVLPTLAPDTGVGMAAIEAYAAREGIPTEAFIARLGSPLTPERAGAAVVELATMPAGDLAAAYVLEAGGLRPL